MTQTKQNNADDQEKQAYIELLVPYYFRQPGGLMKTTEGNARNLIERGIAKRTTAKRFEKSLENPPQNKMVADPAVKKDASDAPESPTIVIVG